MADPYACSIDTGLQYGLYGRHSGIGHERTFPTDGNPISATLASPDFWTSNPTPAPPDLAVGSSSCARYLASFAFKRPRWYSVAYLHTCYLCVRVDANVRGFTLFFCAARQVRGLGSQHKRGRVKLVITDSSPSPLQGQTDFSVVRMAKDWRCD